MGCTRGSRWHVNIRHLEIIIASGFGRKEYSPEDLTKMLFFKTIDSFDFWFIFLNHLDQLGVSHLTLIKYVHEWVLSVRMLF